MSEAPIGPIPPAPPPAPTPSAAPPATPTPPTPPIPLTELLAREELGLHRIAGPAEAEVLWVHTSEMADPYPYLLGGELLLSAGLTLKDPDTYVARLVEAGAAALGFGVTPVFDTVPRALIEACDRHGLPLVEVPPETPFTTIARAVWRLMAEARHRELRRVTRAQQALATAAARPDPVPAVLHQLAAQLGGRAVLLSADGKELHAAGRRPAPDVGAALARLTRVVCAGPRPAPTSATDTVQGAHLSAYALGGGQGLVLALGTDRREGGDHTIAGVAVVLLSLLAAPHQGADAAGRSAALVRLLLGADPQDVAPLLGGAEQWTVVHARRSGGAGPVDPLTAGALGASLGSALVDAGRGRDAVRVLVPGDDRITPQPGWTLGASAPAPITALDLADGQASRSLGRAVATRTPLAHHHSGPGSGLSALIPPDQAEAHARALLAPLTEPLTETLRCWLSLHGSWDRTATALQVHRNTVRQRIARCAALLDADLDDMDVRTELWFALRRG
ncbi:MULTISPECIES: PucR family transcriptional regulator [unclassified Streptomyces]|uniref:PucR family transcriptional regulator n=1 Tax=unclassified Streptomyces TaxID=2593676 RepID=UPI00225A2352|nr:MULTISPECIES: PucR family transcriptional regulator [unclassified Streptomyces]MCX4797394.1 PucR family transcriptional regulator [Streptomyces sp. NBC_01242]WSP55172.1 PucR family transcriptional regulator [Streptomyces sp. NBC_01241]WSP64970.1 PucR family transcriptional regulator [Streptomyces sp. NBC_01240]WSU24103.1 PucR family transcriptional regulator [Streptomyces sp. NBC_01108]